MASPKMLIMTDRAILLNVVRQRTQRGEDPPVLAIVRAQLKAVASGNLESELQCVDGIQAEATPEERCLGVDILGRNGFEIDGGDDQLGELALGRRLRSGHCARRHFGGRESYHR